MKSLNLLVRVVICAGLFAASGYPAAAQQANAPDRRSRDVILRLDHIPEAFLKIGMPPGVTVYRWPPEYGTVPWAGATVYVRKDFDVPRSVGCDSRNLVDEIDLGGILRNGFHLLDARAAPVAPPEGFAPSGPPDLASVELLEGGGEPVEIVRNTKKIRLRPAIWQNDEGGSPVVKCISAYRLNLVLRGPGAQDPLEGF